MTDVLCAWADQGCEPIQASLDGAHWWALMKRQEKKQATPEDETAELLEAAKKIAKTCERYEKCSRCPLVIDGCCAVRVRDAIGGLPCNWWAVRGADNV